MNKQLITWQFIHKSLSKGIPVMLLYVLHSKGSSPGRQGFFMAVNAAGEMEGSIGGGIMEHKLVERAKDKLVSGEEEHTLRLQVHDKSARHQSGMICSGEETVFLYRVHADEIALIERMVHCLQQNGDGLLALSPAGIRFLEGAAPDGDYYFQKISDDDWKYEEKIGYKNQLYLVGGGHCALAFSRLLYNMDFYTRLYEDRPHLNTLQKNFYVHEKHILSDYSELRHYIPSGPHHYVVVMTVGYRSDDTAVRALLGKEFAYFGLLGSAHKIAQMFTAYRSEGLPEEWLQRIHAPIGLPIHSQTPEEIAVSIAAEIIQVKNERSREGLKAAIPATVKNKKEGEV
ncbi:XdhC family protein [Paraflavisolibacter sp. H34]|uniref:XdhC family protein n=1 Tax=Huijunlia imazamoxiresistens TaxID=3127457 RepID=UPI00301799CA